MAMYIVTGCYTSDAIKGLLAAPSNREAAVRPLVEAAGGKMVSRIQLASATLPTV